jgi:hypothetical protein
VISSACPNCNGSPYCICPLTFRLPAADRVPLPSGKGLRREVEALIATAEVSVDIPGYEMDAFLEWLRAYAELRIADRKLEACP